MLTIFCKNYYKCYKKISCFLLSCSKTFFAEFWDVEGKERGLGWHLVSPRGRLVTIFFFSRQEIWGWSVEKVTKEELSKVIGFENLAVKSWWNRKDGGFSAGSPPPAGFSTYWWAPILFASKWSFILEIKTKPLNNKRFVWIELNWSLKI